MGAPAVEAAPAAGRRSTVTTRDDDAAAGDALLHPVVLAALALLLLNDHVLKAAWPGPVTGKLSDVAGMVLFPIVLVSSWELAAVAIGRWRAPSRRALALAVAATATGFGLMKAMPAVADAAGWLFGLAQWALALPVHALLGTAIPPVQRTLVVADPTDLLALPCLAVAAWIGRRRLSTRSSGPA